MNRQTFCMWSHQQNWKWVWTLCSLISKRAMIGNNLISILGAGVMLTSKWAQSFEMIIVARTLFGFSAGRSRHPHIQPAYSQFCQLFVDNYDSFAILGTLLESLLLLMSLCCAAALGTSLHLMYLGEISPRQIRGSVTLTSATFLSLGKLSGQFFGLTYVLL